MWFGRGFGAGVMGETLLSGRVRAGRPVESLLVGEKRPERAAELEERYGVAVVANGSSAGVGQWQAWNGASWVDIGTASVAAAQTFSAATPFRFNPDPNYNGPAPSLTVVLIDNSGPAITLARPSGRRPCRPRASAPAHPSGG